MKRLTGCAVAITLAVTQIGGCANMPQMSQSEQGAGLGAIVGGVLGAAVSRNKAQGAVLGAILGAVAGGLIGNYMDQQNATRAQAAQKYRYDQKVDKLELEGSSVSPRAVSPGGSISAAVQYTTLQPHGASQVRITERRTLVAGNESYDLGKREVTRPQGTHTSTAKVNLPSDLPKGSYRLITTISDGKITRSATSPFSVT